MAYAQVEFGLLFGDGKTKKTLTIGNFAYDTVTASPSFDIETLRANVIAKRAEFTVNGGSGADLESLLRTSDDYVLIDIDSLAVTVVNRTDFNLDD